MSSPSPHTPLTATPWRYALLSYATRITCNMSCSQSGSPTCGEFNYRIQGTQNFVNLSSIWLSFFDYVLFLYSLSDYLSETRSVCICKPLAKSLSKALVTKFTFSFPDTNPEHPTNEMFSSMLEPAATPFLTPCHSGASCCYHLPLRSQRLHAVN